MNEPEDRITVTISEMVHGGGAIARHNDQVVFVDYGIPGEEVVVLIERRKRQYMEGRVVEVVKASPHRVAPPCPYFGTCGGCQVQHIEYSHQLELKRAVVEDALRRIGKFSEPPVKPTVPCANPWSYRNHARFTIDRYGMVGFVRRKSHRFLPIEECRIMHPWINDALRELQGKCGETTQVSIRYGASTGEWLIQPRLKSPAVGLASGQPHYTEALLGHSFRVSSPSFFQVNTPQAETLAKLVKESALGGEPSGQEFVVDAYAGVGTFAVLLSPHVARVLAVEESAAAIKDAMVNLDGIANVELVKGKVEDALPTLLQRPDAVLLDPSRNGCHRRVIDALIELKPLKIVYVSCDPATLARDLRLLCEEGIFTLVDVQPVDMFPQTYHIECVAALTLAGDMH